MLAFSGSALLVSHGGGDAGGGKGGGRGSSLVHWHALNLLSSSCIVTVHENGLDVWPFMVVSSRLKAFSCLASTSLSVSSSRRRPPLARHGQKRLYSDWLAVHEKPPIGV